jgi:hypothetical protein
MTTITATVRDDQKILAKVTNNDQQDLRIRTTTFGTNNKLSELIDVDVTTLKTGSLLVYGSGNNKWTSTTTLDAQNMDGGEF